MADSAQPEVKKTVKKNGVLVYLKKWWFMVIVKMIIDLVLTFIIVSIFIGIGYLLTSLSSIFEMGVMLTIVKKASLILAFCYLLAILITVSIRIYLLIKSDVMVVKDNEQKKPEDNQIKDEKSKEQ